MTYAKNDAMIRLRACTNCSSLDAWPTTVLRSWHNSCLSSLTVYDLGQEPEITTVLCALIGTATVLKARVASKCHTVGW